MSTRVDGAAPAVVRAAGRRAEVARVVNARVAELRWSTAELARLSGLAVNTVRGVREARGKCTKSKLVALSAVLGWDPQYLNDIARGRAGPHTASEDMHDPLLIHLVSGLRADIAAHTEGARRINQKIEVLIELAARKGSGP